MPILTEQERLGTQLAGKYQLESILGRGGMGVVFRARQVHTQRAVAVKILRPEFSQDRTLGKRFIREARAASSIRHPNVVVVLDVGIDEDGTIYQVLELLEGEALSAHLDRKEVLSPERALEILLPVMGALVVAHAQGIVHRDLKPDNIFLARNHDGRVTPTLLDFGIAKLVDHGSSLATHTGSVLGTPQYMAPEQARGSKEQGVGIDVWAMGIIAFECLSGRVPFDGSTPALVMVQIMTERAPRLDIVNSNVPAEIALVIEKALMSSVADRFRGMAEFVEALREAAAAAECALPALRESTAGPITLRPARDTAEALARTEIPDDFDSHSGTDELDAARTGIAARAGHIARDSVSETIAAGGSTAPPQVAAREAVATPVARAPEPRRGSARSIAAVIVAVVAALGLAVIGAFVAARSDDAPSGAQAAGAPDPAAVPDQSSAPHAAAAPSAPHAAAAPSAPHAAAAPDTPPAVAPPVAAEVAAPSVVQPPSVGAPPTGGQPIARRSRMARAAGETARATAEEAPAQPVVARPPPRERVRPEGSAPEVVEW